MMEGVNAVVRHLLLLPLTTVGYAEGHRGGILPPSATVYRLCAYVPMRSRNHAHAISLNPSIIYSPGPVQSSITRL